MRKPNAPQQARKPPRVTGVNKAKPAAPQHLTKKQRSARSAQIASDAEDRRSDRRLRELLACSFLSVYVVAIVATLLLLFFNGFGLTHLNEKTIMALVGATVVELAGIVIIVVKYLFRVAGRRE